MRKILLFGLVVFMLSGCGTVYIEPISRDETPIIDNNTHGILVGSSSISGHYDGDAPTLPFGGVGSSNPRCYHYNIFFQSVDPSETRLLGDMSAVPSGGAKRGVSADHDFAVPDGIGFLQVLILPAGNYEVHHRNVYCGTTNYYLSDLQVPFTIEAGKASYIGEIQYRHEYGKSILGLAGFAGASVIVKDKMARDLPMLLEKYPFLHAYEISSLDIDWSRLYTPVEKR